MEETGPAGFKIIITEKGGQEIEKRGPAARDTEEST